MSKPPRLDDEPSDEESYTNVTSSVEKKGVHFGWRKTRSHMTNNEQLMHLQQELDYYKDKQLVSGDKSFQTNIDSVKREIEKVSNPSFIYSNPPRSVPNNETPKSEENPPRTVPNNETPKSEENNKRHPSGWTPINWKPNNQYVTGLISSFRVTTFSLVRFISGYLSILLQWILPLVLFIYFIDLSSIDFSFISKIYSRLTSFLPDIILSFITALFLTIMFLIKLLLMIRKTKKSKGSYDKLFSFISHNFLSGIIYFFILLVSLVIVYFTG
jgi:hypothetical protein